MRKLTEDELHDLIVRAQAARDTCQDSQVPRAQAVVDVLLWLQFESFSTNAWLFQRAS